MSRFDISTIHKIVLEDGSIHYFTKSDRLGIPIDQFDHPIKFKKISCREFLNIIFICVWIIYFYLDKLYTKIKNFFI